MTGVIVCSILNRDIYNFTFFHEVFSLGAFPFSILILLCVISINHFDLSWRAGVVIIDGQAAALRLSKHIAKATRAIKDLAIKFNALGASTQSVVEFTHLLDPQSPVYSDVDLFDQVFLWDFICEKKFIINLY